jgi:hypothetical protein
MDTDESEIKVLELPEWVKLVNELVKKEKLKSPKYPAEAKPGS